MDDQTFRASIEAPDTVPGDDRQTFTAVDFRRFIRLRRWVILLPIMIGCGGAYIYSAIAIPTYSARAQIIIDPRLPQFIPGHNEETVLAWDSAQVESEIAVLQSERIAGAVVTKLSLDTAADFRRPPPLTARLTAWITRVEPKIPPFALDRFRDALSMIEAGLGVRRTGLSYAIDITYSYPDPARATEIANAMAEAYITDQLVNRSQAARLGGEWLQRRMVFLRSQMNAASAAVQVFKAGHNYAIPRGSQAETADPGVGTPASSPPEAPVTEVKTLDELEASASTYRRIYESFLQSFTESVQRQSFPVSDARILTPASLPTLKSAPRLSLIFALGGLIGTLVGCGAAIALHHVDRNLYTAPQVAQASGFQDLGQLPLLRRGPLHRLWWVVRGRVGRARRRPGSRALAPLRAWMKGAVAGRRFRRGGYYASSLERPGDGFSRAMVSVKTMLELEEQKGSVAHIGVTACQAGSGTSVLASNLASLFADCGKRTLIIDAGFHGSRGITPGHLRSRCGLQDLLKGTTTLDEVLVPVGGTTLTLLPPGGDQSSDRACLTVDRMEDLLNKLGERFDVVVVDLPPLLPAAEALAVSAAFDGLVLAVEGGRTKSDTVATSARHLGRAGAHVFGFVLTKV